MRRYVHRHKALPSKTNTPDVCLLHLPLPHTPLSIYLSIYLALSVCLFVYLSRSLQLSHLGIQVVFSSFTPVHVFGRIYRRFSCASYCKRPFMSHVSVSRCRLGSLFDFLFVVFLLAFLLSSNHQTHASFSVLVLSRYRRNQLAPRCICRGMPVCVLVLFSSFHVVLEWASSSPSFFFFFLVFLFFVSRPPVYTPQFFSFLSPSLLEAPALFALSLCTYIFLLARVSLFRYYFAIALSVSLLLLQ